MGKVLSPKYTIKQVKHSFLPSIVSCWVQPCLPIHPLPFHPCSDLVSPPPTLDPLLTMNHVRHCHLLSSTNSSRILEQSNKGRRAAILCGYHGTNMFILFLTIRLDSTKFPIVVAGNIFNSENDGSVYTWKMKKSGLRKTHNLPICSLEVEASQILADDVV